jgi:hypothetical protein
MDQLEYMTRVLSLINPYDCDEILWNIQDGKVRFQVNCSDFFHWACADCEDVTEENIELLENCYKELEGLTEHYKSYAKDLFCCRVRQMRPQQPVLTTLPEEIKPLFEVFPD